MGLWLLGTTVCLVALALPRGALLWTDEAWYLRIAANAHAGLGFCSSSTHWSFWPPLLPLGLTLAKAVGLNEILVAHLVNAGLAGGICLLIYLMGSRVFSPQVGLAAGVIACFYPPLPFYSRRVLTEVPYTFILALIVWLSLRSSPRWRFGWAIVVGALIGLSALLRSEGIGILVVIGMYQLIASRGARRQVAAPTATMVLAYLVVLTPWVIRNAVVHRSFVLLTTNGGYNMFAGSLTGPTRFRPSYEEFLTPQQKAAVRRASEAERDRLYYRYAWQRFRANPLRQLRLMAGKAVRFWFGPDFDGTTVWAQPYDLVLLPLSWVGLVLALLRRIVPAALFLLVVLYRNALAALFFPELRFQFPLFPYLMMSAAYAAAILLPLVSRRRQRAFCPPTQRQRDPTP